MADKVVHFEVVGKDGPKLMQFYGRLFGWTVNADNPMNYGMVDAEESGIGGGISSSQEGSDGHLTFYVGVDDLQATLDKAESLGGKTVMPPTEIPNVVTFALLNDPEGHLVGLVKSNGS
jgi:predicted enzyme related to lactoylglutathione lyase